MAEGNEGVAAALTVSPQIEETLGRIEKLLGSMADSAGKMAEKFSGIGDSLKTAFESIGGAAAGKGVATEFVKQAEIIGRATDDLNKTGAAYSKSTIKSEEELNASLTKIFEKRADSLQSIRQRLVELEKFQDSWFDSNQYSFDNYNFGIDGSMYQKSSAYITDLKNRISELKMEFDMGRAKNAFEKAMGLDDSSYESAMSKLRAMDKAMIELKKPGAESAENSSQVTAWLVALNNEIERVTTSLPRLKQEFDDAKKAANELNKQQSAADKASNKLLAAYGLPEENPEELRHKISAVSSALRELKQLYEEGNIFVSKDDVNEPVKELERMGEAVRNFKAEALTGNANQKLDWALGLDENTVQEMEVKLRRILSLLNSESVVKDADPFKLQEAKERAQSLVSIIDTAKMSVQADNLNSKLTTALGMDESTMDAVKDKIGQVKSAYVQLLHAADKNGFVNKDEIERAIKELERLRAKYEDMSLDEKLTNKHNDITHYLGLDQNNVDELTAKISLVRRNLDEFKRILEDKGVTSPEDKSFIEDTSKQLDVLNARLHVTQHNLGRTSEAARTMGSMLKRAFSFALVSRYAENVIKLRGEFELAEKSLGVIINDANKAKSIFNDIQKIAVRSPFQVKDLVKQTKQLAAYRIETDKLVETTKMLGDISAGVGTDMNRLILAYGQVKAATYLRGTELRQFSEAGVNMLGGLADRFTELNGRIVTTGEVMQMISKRMVSFEDVDAVLRAQTQAGGTFYKMQEKQAETLSGRLSNLRDRIDIMFNEIGKSSQGLLNTAISMIEFFVEHYEGLVTILSGALIGKAVTSLVGGIGGLLKGVSDLGKTMKDVFGRSKTIALFAKELSAIGGIAPAVGLAFAALSALIVIIRQFTKTGRELRKASKEAVEDNEEMEQSYKRLAASVSNTNKPLAERQKALDELKTTFGNIIPLENASINNIKREGVAYENNIRAIREYNAERLREKQVLIAIESEEKKRDRRVNNIKGSLRNIYQYAAQQPGFGDRNAFSGLKDIFSKNDTFIENLYDEITEEILSGTLDREAAIRKMYKAISLEYLGSESRWEEIANFFERGADGGVKVFNGIADTVDKLYGAYGKIQRTTEKFATNLNLGEGGQEVERAIKGLTDYMNSWSAEHANEFVGDPAGLKLAAEKAVKERIEAIRTAIESGDYRNMENPMLNIFAFGMTDSQKERARKALVTASASLTSGGLTELFDKTFSELNQKYDKLIKKFGQGDLMKRPDESLKDFAKRLNDMKKEYDDGIAVWDKWDGRSMVSFANIAESVGGTREQLKDMSDAIGEVLPLFSMLGIVFDKAADKAAATEYKNNLKAFVSEVQKASKELDKLDNEGDEIYMGKLKYLASKVKVSLPENFSEATVKAWLESLKGKFDKDEFADILLSVNENTVENRVKKLSDTTAELWKKYNNAKKLEGWGFNIDGMNSAQIYKELLAKEEEANRETSESGKKLAEDLRNKRLEILSKEQEDAARIIYEAQKKVLSKTEQAYQKAWEDIAVIQKGAGDKGTDYILGQDKIDAGIKARIKGAIDEVTKAEWEAFKTTEMYAMAFGDLGGVGKGVLAKLKSELEGFKLSEALNPTEMRTITNAIQKIDEELTRTNASGLFKTFADGFRMVGEAMNTYMTELPIRETEYINALNNLSKAEYENVEAKEALNNAPNDEQAQQRAVQAVKDLEKAREEASVAGKNYIEVQKEISNQFGEAKKKVEKLTSAYSSFTSVISEAIGLSEDIADALGLSLSDDTIAALEGIEKGFSLVGSAINVASGALTAFTVVTELATIAGYNLQAAFWPLIVIGEVVATALAIIKINDAKISKQIESHKEAVEKLQKAYDELSEAMDRAIDLDKANVFNKTMQENLEKQRRELEEALALNGQRKQNDKAKEEAKDLQNQLDDVNKAIQDNKDEWLEFMGATSDWQGLARDWASSWLDAFKAGEDGLASLEDSFDELWESIVSVQLSDFLNGPINNIRKALSDALEDGKVTDEEARYIQAFKDNLKSAYAEGTDFLERMGINRDAGEASGDTLKKGIESVTEQTAQALEGILNSTRFYVADNNRILLGLEQTLVAEGDNTILANIRSQTRYLQTLATIAEAVYYPGGHSKGAGGIKVFVD